MVGCLVDRQKSSLAACDVQAYRRLVDQIYHFYSFSGGSFFLFRAMVGAGQQAAREVAAAQAACCLPMAGGDRLRVQEARGR